MTYKLIKELGKSGKMQVSPEQSEIVQLALFEMGNQWNIDGQTITDLDKPFIFWDNGYILYASEECDYLFEVDELPLHLFDNHFETINP